MKVDRQGLTGAMGVRRADNGRPNQHAQRRGDSGGDQPVDRLTLSARSLRVSELQPALETQPAVRAELIQRLKEEIARGEYRVNPHQLAERLLRAGVIE